MGMKSEIEQALDAHAAWRKHFKDFLNGRGSFDTATVGANDQCQFGKWLNREGSRLMPASLYGDIRAAHDEFHHVAAGIVQKIKDSFSFLVGKGKMTRDAMDAALSGGDVAAVEGAAGGAKIVLVEAVRLASLGRLHDALQTWC